LATATVRRHLASAGIAPGYDPVTRKHVALGVAETDVPDGADSLFLLSVRERLHPIALLRAKQNLLEEMSATVAGTDAVADRFAADGSAETLGKSALTVWANGLYCGFLPLFAAESLENGRYQVALAVEWSAQSERDARAALSGNGPMPRNDAIPSPEWKKWASSRDFSLLCGAWPFFDSEGIRRFAGVGVADAEGKTGAELLAAMRLARAKAAQALAQALYGDIAAGKTAAQMLALDGAGDGAGAAVSLESFDKAIRQSVQGKSFRDAEVHETTAVHPISGRKLCVSVVGIEPRDLAEMGLLGRGASVAPRGAAGRPDHGVSPPSRRPDHSFRPATARPVHPGRDGVE